jgi:hypothetical protein
MNYEENVKSKFKEFYNSPLKGKLFRRRNNKIFTVLVNHVKILLL